MDNIPTDAAKAKTASVQQPGNFKQASVRKVPSILNDELFQTFIHGSHRSHHTNRYDCKECMVNCTSVKLQHLRMHMLASQPGRNRRPAQIRNMHLLFWDTCTPSAVLL